MKKEKEIINITSIIAIIMLLEAIFLEWKVDTLLSVFQINILSGHRAFIINISLSIFTCCIISCISASVYYKNKEEELMNKIYILGNKIILANGIILSLLEKNRINRFIPLDYFISSDFVSYFEKLNLYLEEFRMILLEFDFHNPYIFKFNQTNKTDNIKIQIYISNVKEFRKKVSRLNLSIRQYTVTPQKEYDDLFKTKFESEIKTFIKELGDESELFKSFVNFMDLFSEYKTTSDSK